MKRTLTEIGQIVRANQPRLRPAPPTVEWTPEGLRVSGGLWEPHEALALAAEIGRRYGGRDG